MRVIAVKGHDFIFEGSRKHLRVDCTVTTVYMWRKVCEHPGCDESWCFSSPAFNREGVQEPPEAPSRHYWSSFDRFTCKAHKPVVKRQIKDRIAKVGEYRGRQLVSDTEVMEMRKIAANHEGSSIALYKALALVYPCTWTTAREIVKGRRRATVQR